MTEIGLILVSYLVGSVPWGYLVARFGAGVDIRQMGSRNIGATNVWRTLGAKYGIAVLLLDALKGLLPTWGLPLLIAGPQQTHVAVGCGIAAVIGHMFPCWLGFRGGKGVATGLGVAIILGPRASLVALAVFLVTLVTARIVSLGSILAACAFAVTQIWLLWPHPFGPANWSVSLFSLGVPVLIVIRHRGNIVRLWGGEENRFSFRKRREPPPSPDPPAKDESGQ
ncbi:MAG: glycerol-3-phosphate 1-O-acyltransferase PlsY [Planctomycetaceae bacterium]